MKPFETFNEEYVRRLTEGDPATCEHFARYFGNVLELKARARLRSSALIEDVVQETLTRVLIVLREGDGVERPDRFGVFVTRVCEFVLCESLRLVRRFELRPFEEDERLDPHPTTDEDLLDEEKRQAIDIVLAKMAPREAAILRMIYLEGKPKPEICAAVGVSMNYLRVLVHRAKAEFRRLCDEDGFAFTPGES